MSACADSSALPPCGSTSRARVGLHEPTGAPAASGCFAGAASLAGPASASGAAIAAHPTSICVLDTNIWLDWLVFDDPSIASLRASAADDHVHIATCVRGRGELAEVLTRPGFGLTKEAQRACLARFDRLTRIYPDPPSPCGPRLVCSDPDDQVFLDLALSIGARTLLSRDKALLRLRGRARALGLTIARPDRWVPPSAPVPDSLP